MAWIVFYVVIIAFSLGLISFFYCLASEKVCWDCSMIVGPIDVTLGLSLRTIVKYLFS